MPCNSSKAFVSSLTSRIEEIEVDVRVGFAVAVPDERAGGGLAALAAGSLAALAEGGFVPGAMLCLALKGARLTPSDTDARGRAAEDVAEPAGETTEGRVTLVGAAGFALAEADNEGLERGGAAGFADATESLRLGGGFEGGTVREEAMGAFGGTADALVDFLRTGAIEDLTVADCVTTVGFDAAGRTFPAPNVPELIIYIPCNKAVLMKAK